MVDLWVSATPTVPNQWPGVAGVVQTVMLLFSSTVFYAGRDAGPANMF